MRTPLATPALCICVLIGGLVGYAWAQATMDIEAESALVKSVIDLMMKAINSGNLTLLLALYADDAKIDSRAAGAKVSKPAYAEAMSRTFQRGSILSSRYSGLKISFVDATHAVAEGTLHVTLKGGGGFTSQHEWKMEKRDGRWLIVETNYK
jgi:ketosteroid isomerase-like protein